MSHFQSMTATGMLPKVPSERLLGPNGSEYSSPRSPDRRFPFSSEPKNGVTRRRFKSARFRPGDVYEKEWLDEPEPRQKWEKVIFWGSVAIGFAFGGLLCYWSYISVSKFDYCLIFEDNFQTLNKEHWNFEIQRGGFGSGTFEWTTDDPKNAYVDAQGLHIVPTLTNETTEINMDLINDNHVVNLTTAGTCTALSGDENDCSVRSNVTAGTIINPVRSARMNTMGKKSLTYGRIEVVAKAPIGDWLWPAIWLMPEPKGPQGVGAYGPWPASGEIDIAEFRGNKGSEYPDGLDVVNSALHWGPVPMADAFWLTGGKYLLRRGKDYSQAFHTYGLEWSEDYMFTYIDTRLVQVMFTKFSKYANMWEHGNFGESVVNKSALHDPWSYTGRANTPFDQPFYLILNVAVGGTNGYFKDGVASKPWGNGSPKAPREFWAARDQWLPTWGAGDTRGMTIKSVKMWSQGKCGTKA